jgi:heptosyltransferase-2
VLNDNSSNGTARSWGAPRHAALARWLVARVPGVRVLVHCGPADRDEARAVVAEAASPAVRGLGDAPDLPIGLSKAVYARAAAAVSSDSGPRHIAAAFRRPTIVLHGSMDPRLSRSEEPRLVELRLDLPCSPCGKRTCPLVHHDCMRLLAVDDVGRSVLTLLQENSRCCSS